MAGYGNRTAPDTVADDLQEEHTNTRLGLHDSHAAYSNAHSEHGSGTTGGAGFGTYAHPHNLTPHPDLSTSSQPLRTRH